MSRDLGFFSLFFFSSSIFRSLLTESALNNWSVKHADVKNAFCNARIDVPDLFITMPNGIVCHDPNPSDNARRGILLEKALCGLKQSPRLFFLDIKKLLLDKGPAGPTTT